MRKTVRFQFTKRLVLTECLAGGGKEAATDSEKSYSVYENAIDKTKSNLIINITVVVVFIGLILLFLNNSLSPIESERKASFR